MTDTATLRIDTLFRYPVKGLSPEPLEQATLETSGYFPGDRLYAVENGPSGFNAVAPRHLPKTKYLMLMRDEALARLRTRYEDDTGTLHVAADDGARISADLRTPEGRTVLEGLMRRVVPDGLRGPPRVLEAPPQYRFTDSATGYVSLINLASVAAVEDMLGAPVDPLRFRGNLYVTGLAAWAELDLVGRTLEGADGLRLRITQRTQRCAAVNVEPASGVRDLEIPWTLDRHLGHRDCGIYAEVVAGGTIQPGDELRVLG